MPVARFQMQDGRIARFEVPEGTTPEQAQAMIQAELPKVSPHDTAQAPAKIGRDAFPDTLRQVLRETDWGTRNIAGAGTALTNLWEGAKQLVGQSNQDNIRNQRIIREEAPVGAIGGDVLMTAVPFGLAGNSLKAAGAVGAGYRLTQPVETDSAIDAIKGKAINTALGGATAAGGQYVANKLLGGVLNKMGKIEQKVADKAAQVAEAETASARSAAGNAAQNAYRQLEHLRELGVQGSLTPQQKVLVAKLERELADKTIEKLAPAAAMKQSTAEAYKEAMKTEAQRAADYAAGKLSGNEVKQQVMARLKRYGPAALGGIAGNLIFPGLGGTVGGAATGLVLRPAIRSMVNLSKNPAVQHGALSAVRGSGLLTKPVIPVSSLLAAEGLLGLYQEPPEDY